MSVSTSRYLRPTEVDALIGDASKAESTLSWKAQTYAPQLAQIMVKAEVDAIEGRSGG